ncbi:hypothetical protein ACFLEY_42585 [Bradyrhizobium sp. YCK136]
MIEAERRRADDECSARLHVESELAASKESVERLELLVKEYERARFPRGSVKIPRVWSLETPPPDDRRQRR